MQGIVLGIGEKEPILLADVDGSGVGVDKASGVGEDPFHEDVQVLDLVEFDPQFHEFVEFFFFREHIRSFPAIDCPAPALETVLPGAPTHFFQENPEDKCIIESDRVLSSTTVCPG